uniref:Uncharacterized protein n=1 Tax=Oryza glumipatula TaxID=40148 RepID=A0A0D9Z7K4_9ORYZ
MAYQSRHAKHVGKPAAGGGAVFDLRTSVVLTIVPTPLGAAAVEGTGAVDARIQLPPSLGAAEAETKAAGESGSRLFPPLPPMPPSPVGLISPFSGRPPLSPLRKNSPTAFGKQSKSSNSTALSKISTQSSTI